MAPLGLHRGVAVDPRREAGAHAHHHRRHVHTGPQVALGQNRVDHGIGRQRADHPCVRIDHHGDVARGGDRARDTRIGGEAGRHVLHARLAQTDGLGERDRPAYAGWFGDIRHNHLAADAMQAQRDTGGDVAGAPHVNKHGIFLSVPTA